MKEKKDLDRFIDSVREVSPSLTDEAVAYFINNIEIKEFQAKAVYIKSGDVQEAIGYVAKGLIRAYYIDSNGKEINVAFIKEGYFAGHYAAFASQSQSKYFFSCMEECTIINIPYTHFYECCRRYHPVEHYYCLMLRRELCFKQERIDSFIFDNAETRYRNFISSNPDLINRISVSMLSSYLGIERQTLTRIRKKLLYK